MRSWDRRNPTYVIRRGTTLVCTIPKGWGIRFEGDMVIAARPNWPPKSIRLDEAEHVPFHEWPELRHG